MNYETNRLLFQPIQSKDWHNLLRIYQQTATMKYVGSSSVSWNLKAVEKKFSSNSSNYAKGLGIYKAVEKETSKTIAEVGVFNSFDELDRIEIGFIIDEAYWNQGYGTEICKGLIDYCFRCLKAVKVVSRMYLENTASEQVAIKSGMHCVDRFEVSSGQWGLMYEIEVQANARPLK